MALVLGLDDICEADEAQATDVDVVQASIVAARVGVIVHWPEVRGGQARGQVILPTVGKMIRGSSNRHSGGLMARVGNNFYGVGVKMVISNGLGGIIKHGRHVVLGYDVARNRRRVRDMCGLLNVALEYLAAGR